MKCKIIKNGFKPFTITIETEDEAKILWHKFNVSSTRTLKDYYRDEGIDEGIDENAHERMWECINKVFPLNNY